MLHQNIAGLLNKKDILEVGLLEFSQRHIDIDIICLSETFIKSDHESNIYIKGYQLASSFSRQSQKRGGVAILCKTNIINYRELSCLKNVAIEKDFECCGIDIPDYKLSNNNLSL